MNSPTRSISLPDPRLIHTKPGFFKAMIHLRSRTPLPYRAIADKVPLSSNTTKQPHTTIADWLRGKALPGPGSERQFEQLLRHVFDITDGAEVNEWLAALARARHEPTDRPEPYRGLASYRTEDAEWYFGRAELTDRLVERVAALASAGGGVELVVGASGAGKTSLLHAGLIPALRAGRQDLRPNRIVSFTPGPDPVAQLTRCLDHNAADGDVPVDGCTVLIVDQMEQLFTACDDPAVQDTFVTTLGDIARTGLVVVVGLRADFYDRALRYQPLMDAITRGQFTVGAMTEDELRTAITAPAAKANAEIEPGLVELLLRDLTPRNTDRQRFAHDPGALPLLSHALSEMYLHSPDRRLTAEGYRQVDGIDGAVAATADRVYEELTGEQQEIARCLFLDLVHVTVDAADTRRRVHIEALIGGADAIVQQQVLDRFVSHRIITVDTDTVEISHEAVLTAWPQLRKWLQSDRAGHLVGQQLVSAAAAWRDDPDPSALYQGTRLAAAQEWITDRRRRVPSATTEFVAASLQHGRRRTRRLQRTVAALVALLVLVAGLSVFAFYQREVALAARSAADQQRDEAQSRAIAVQSADLRTKDATVARQLAVAAYRAAPTVEARSALLDASAVRSALRLRGSDSIGIMYSAAFHPTGRVLAASTETGVRLWALDGNHPTRLATLPTESGAKIYHLAFSPDGRLLAAASADGRIRLWNTTDPAAPAALAPLTGLDGRVHSLAFTADGAILAAASSSGYVHLYVRDPAGRVTAAGSPLAVSAQPAKSVAFRNPTTLVVGTADGKVTLWNVAAPASPVYTATLAGPTKEIGQVVSSPDGRMLAAGSADTNAYLWTSAGASVATALTGASSWINSVAFSPDNASLAVGSSDAELGVRVYDVATGTVTATLPHPVPVTAVKFSPDGKTIVTTANDGYARLWPVTAPTLELPGPVSATRFSPDKRLLAVGSDDTRLYDVSDPDHPTPVSPGLPNPDSFNSALAFTPDSRTLATGHGRSGTIRLWDVTDPYRPRAHGAPITAHKHQIEALTFSPDGRLLATGSRDTTARLWDTSDPKRITLLATLTDFTGIIFSVAFSPDGRYLAAASSDKTIRIWDVTDPRRAAPVGGPIPAANHYIYSVAFSPDGRILASSSADQTIRLWDVTTIDRPAPIGAPLRGPTNYVYQVTFSSDGTTLAAAVTDATVWVWDVRTRERIAKLTLPNDAVYSIDVHPDRRTVVAGGADQRAYVWTMDPERATARICATIGDPITADEWATHIPDRPYEPPCQ